MTFRRNGMVIPTAAVPSTVNMSITNLYLNTGSSTNATTNTSNAQIAELFLWGTPLSDADVITVETYLATKWGLQSELAPTHPAYKAPTTLTIAPDGTTGFPVDRLCVWADATQYTDQADGTTVKSMLSRTGTKKYTNCL